MADGIRIELVGCEAILLGDIANKRLKRRDIATTYALTLRSSEQRTVDWKKVNGAILARWSPYALNWIKERAWKIAEGKLDPTEDWK